MRRRLVLAVILSGLSVLGHSADISQEQASLLAGSFRTLALKGSFSEPKLLAPLGILNFWQLENADFLGTEFQFIDYTCEVKIVKSLGKIYWYEAHQMVDPDTNLSNRVYPDYPTLPVLPQSTIIALAKQYLAAAGFECDYTARSISLSEPTSIVGENYYEVEMWPSKGAAIADIRARLKIESTTGTLLDFHHPLPSLEFPNNVNPAISIDSARGLMLSICSTQLGCGVPIEEDPIHLEATQPFRQNPETTDPFTQVLFTPAEIALGDQNKTILTYCGVFKCGDRGSYSFCVDAMTGELKVQWQLGSYGSSQEKALRPMGWDWGLGPISAMNGKKAIVAQNADIAECKPSTIPKAGVKLFIHRGRMNVPIVFDAKSGLIWHEIGGKRRYGKPNASLVKALMKVVR